MNYVAIGKQVELFFSKEALIYALKGFIASFLAIYISMAFDLGQPLWAFLTALFLHTRSETGFIAQKAAIKVLITAIAVVVSFSILGLFLPYPSLALSCLALYLAFMATLSSTITNINLIYAFTMANVTCIIVVLDSVVGAPNISGYSIFLTVHSRLEQILIGAACATAVNYLFFPKKIIDTLSKDCKTIVDQSFDLLEAVLKYQSERDEYDKHIQKILSTLVAFDNNLTGAKYEGLKSNNYLCLSSKALELIKAANNFKLDFASMENNRCRDETINRVLTKVSQLRDKYSCSLKEEIKELENSLNIKSLSNLIESLYDVIKVYDDILSKKNTTNQKYYVLTNYYNIPLIVTSVFRSVLLFGVLSSLWIYTESPKAVFMIIIAAILSQMAAFTPKAHYAALFAIVGYVAAVPGAIIALNILSQALGYFELLVVVCFIPFFFGFLLIHYNQLLGLGFTGGVLLTISPSNQMTFNIADTLGTGAAFLVGVIATGLIFMLIPHPQKKLTQMIATKALRKDIRKFSRLKMSHQEYLAKIAKKILCIYDNRISDDSISNRNLDFALRSLSYHQKVKGNK
ncbi:FUSC family protein [Francisella sp. XLW-1]|uniref:FUSC family protein n=1 Tax=Francisella sp. XLW-1 TaxID=2610887 RepID=UPI00168CFF92|nr:FUSC family protein [Francisella sp. XLW-1]